MADTIRFSHRPDTELRFTNGECGALAEAIHRRTGWPIAVITTSCAHLEESQHAVVKIPDGRYVDIEGIWTEDDLLAHWTNDYGYDWASQELCLRDLTDEQWESEVDGLRYWHDSCEVTDARAFARRIIERVNLELAAVPC